MATNLVPATDTTFPVDVVESELETFELIADQANFEPSQLARFFRPLDTSILRGDVRAVIFEVDYVAGSFRDKAEFKVNYIFAASRENERGAYQMANVVNILPVVMFGDGLTAEEDIPVRITGVKIGGFPLKSPGSVKMTVTFKMNILEFAIQESEDFELQ
jgi:hypothetical protein